MGMFSDDIVRDIFRRVVEAAQRSGGFDEQMAMLIEHQVRNDWGGQQVYMCRNPDGRRAERDAQIYSMYWDEGQRDVGRLAQRFGLSARQIRRIVYGDRTSHS